MVHEATGVIHFTHMTQVTSHPEFVVKFGNYGTFKIKKKNGFFTSYYKTSSVLFRFLFLSPQKQVSQKRVWITYNGALWNILDF